MIGTNRRPPKKASQGTNFSRWKRCHSIPAVMPMTMPPKTFGSGGVRSMAHASPTQAGSTSSIGPKAVRRC